MAEETKYVTTEEFQPVKFDLEKLTGRVELLTIRVEVLSNDMHRLTHQVGDIAEDLVAFRDEMNVFRDEMNRRFTGLEQTQAAILSAVMRLLPG